MADATNRPQSSRRRKTNECEQSLASFRKLTSEQRATAVEHTIDPGFVNRRLVETVLGTSGVEAIDQAIRGLPDLPDWMREVRIDHIYTRTALAFCRFLKVRSLGELVHEGKGLIFCSTEPLAACRAIYDPGADRLVSRWKPRAKVSLPVEFHYSRANVRGDTLRSQLFRGSEVSIIGQVHGLRAGTLIIHPLVIGNPWLESDDPAWTDRIMWWGRNFYEHFIEDFAEFDKVKAVQIPQDSEPMRLVSERSFKRALATILGGEVPNDWGGETSDYVSSALHVGGRRVSAAFLLKGPARFAPMTLNQLGKNNDQIFRLAQEAADILVIQHCHDITTAVRATLRAFAVQPSNQRRYCVIDGRDSLRLLKAYDLYDTAVRWTAEDKQTRRRSRQ